MCLDIVTCLLCQDGPVDVRALVKVSILNNLWGMLTGQTFSVHNQRLAQLLDYIQQAFTLQDMSGGILNQMPFVRHIAPEYSTYNKALQIVNDIQSFIIVRISVTMLIIRTAITYCNNLNNKLE